VRGIVLFVVSLILIGIGVTFGAYRHDIDTARARASTGSRIVETRCGPIEYAVAGEGTPVLVVHGAGGGFDQALNFATPLVKRGFRIIAMSRFGYLRTPLPVDASAQAQAAAHVCLLDAIQVRRAAIIGASAGAPSSMKFALQYPERTTALVLLVPAAFVPRPGQDAPLRTPPGTEFLFNTALRSDFLFWAASRTARQTVVRAILATPPALIATASLEDKERIAQVLESILPVSQRRLGLLNDAAITSTLSRYDLEHIGAPTLVISTADDLFGTFDGARYTADHIAGARFIGYPSGGHLWVGHQQDVLSEISNFLSTGGLPATLIPSPQHQNR
jgi:2-hydroxy-6-oxonona-2,4-dienedioate hydrolase